MLPFRVARPLVSTGMLVLLALSLVFFFMAEMLLEDLETSRVSDRATAVQPRMIVERPQFTGRRTDTVANDYQPPTTTPTADASSSETPFVTPSPTQPSPVPTPAPTTAAPTTAMPVAVPTPITTMSTPSPTPSVTSTPSLLTAHDDLSDYACVKWRRAAGCSPQGPRLPTFDQNCSTPISYGLSGYCEVQHKTTGELKRVMPMHCNSLRWGVQFTCDSFQSLLSYANKSTAYIHDAEFSFEKNQEQLRRANQLAEERPLVFAEEGIVGRTNTVPSLERGIVMVIYERLLLGAYVSIRSLREMGSTLPVEMWCKKSETNVDHPLLKLLVAEYGVYLREIDDPNATRFYTKLHAVFYSAFDNVLLLDADNFPVRDPAYLFETPEFVDNGAVFWPDFWKPGNTIFNIHQTSFVWTFFGLKYTDMFEQESGQILISRRKHMLALNVLMFYGFSLPRVHESMKLVWGDKDLFRFAWMKTNSSFHMIQRPPGSAGVKHDEFDSFCGVTMVQHDPAGKIVFLHRNTEKLLPTNDRLVWTHIQQFRLRADIGGHVVRGANGGKLFPQFRRCFGKDSNYQDNFKVKSITQFPFADLEPKLLKYAREGAELVANATRQAALALAIQMRSQTEAPTTLVPAAP